MELNQEQQKFYDDCLTALKSRNLEAEYYLPMLKRYVQTTFKAQAILDEIMEEAVTVEHTNKADHTNEASSPKARMYALFNEQAMKLGKELGLSLSTAKVGRPSKAKKKGFELGGKVVSIASGK